VRSTRSVRAGPAKTWTCCGERYGDGPIPLRLRQVDHAQEGRDVPQALVIQSGVAGLPLLQALPEVGCAAMIRKGSISALVAAGCLWVAGVLVPWLFVVHVWGKMRRGV
jgi:hypothetical protein